MSTTTTPAKAIGLHPAQQAFLNSKALFKAFVGGIGSGKTWAGSYDLIRRAKAGRLYLVTAPTFTMLADSTFRMFVAVAQELGVVNAADIRRSAPPSIKLRTGAEILFRSADDPERLRGPNLSGIWLDEASLMPEETFSVAIGRLREAGEQGWLSATFTPKGKGHWTYETFGSGRPDTELFHSRTADNPFLPENFASTVRRQYTSTLAAQELEGLFIDAGGTLFQRQWFGIVEPRDLPPLTLVRAWDLAATVPDEKKSSDPDWTVGALLGRADNGTIFILDVRRIRGSPQTVQALVRSTAEADGPAVQIFIEQEPGSAGVTVIDHFRRHVLPGYAFYGERSTGSKIDRALPMAAMAEGGAVKMLRAPWNKDFLDEGEVFPAGRHDDQIDAASLAFSKVAAGYSWLVTSDPTPSFVEEHMPDDVFLAREEQGAELAELKPWEASW